MNQFHKILISCTLFYINTFIALKVIVMSKLLKEKIPLNTAKIIDFKVFINLFMKTYAQKIIYVNNNLSLEWKILLVESIIKSLEELIITIIWD